MPVALKYVPATDTKRDEFRVAVMRERTAIRERYNTAMSYYKGNHPDQLGVYDGVDDNTFINLVKMTADRTSTFLFSAVPKFQIDPASLEDTPEEVYIKEVIEANGGLAFLVKLALRGFMAGHSFVKVMYRKNAPSIVLLNPLDVLVYTRADDSSSVLWYEVRMKVGNTYIIEDYVQNEHNEAWTVYTYHKQIGTNINILNNTHHEQSLRGDLELDMLSFAGFAEVKREAHNFAIPPIIDIPHLPDPDSFYGLNEVDQIDLQNTINRVISELNRIIRENADPVDVLTGADLEEIKDEGGIIAVPAAGAKVQRLELKSDLMGINGTLNKLIEVYLTVSRVVLLSGDVKDLQRVTNASVRTLFLDAIAKNNILKSTYGEGLKKVIRLCLMFGYKFGKVGVNPENLPLTIKFAEPLPTDLSEIANIAAILVPMGAQSLATTSEMMGNEWSFEHSAIKSEREEKLEWQKKEAELTQPKTPEITPSVHQQAQKAAAELQDEGDLTDS